MRGMIKIVGFLILSSATIKGKLIGDHVCQEEKRYTVNVTEYFIRNSTIRNYEWCLNVPPRCSFYTTKLINDSRVVEKEVTDFIDKCCPGFSQENNTCIPVCPECVNGTCSRGICDCFPGYKGVLCDRECDVTEWGKNCQHRCVCGNGYCDPKTGNCNCQNGWTGQSCQEPCPDGYFGHRCRQQCNCQICDHVTGECPPTTTTTSTEKSTTTVLPTEKSTFFEIQLKNNGKFDIDTLIPTVTSVATETESTVEKQTTTPAPIVVVKSAKVNAKEVTMTTGRPQQDDHYVNDEARRGDFDLPSPPINKNDLVSGASAATAISVAVIIVAVVIVAANHVIKNKKKTDEEQERGKGMPTVSVYAHSIFHTPLPDPPTFETPIFIAPLDPGANGEGQRFETRVVCSMNFPSHPAKDPREYLYDHPPSTGSYRAAEPPDIEMSPVTHCEPVYDEIPSGMIPAPVSQPPPSYKSASLYMNTCGKTRL